MNLVTKKQDLFKVNSNYYLVQCVSRDFACGKGIAVEFNRKFDIKHKIKPIYDSYNSDVTYPAILVDNVFNLITKEKYYQKPTYASITEAIQDMKNQCLSKGITRLAMPKIGCGLDKLSWERVHDIIMNEFADTDISILVCEWR